MNPAIATANGIDAAPAATRAAGELRTPPLDPIMRRITMVGFGAIGHAVLAQLRGDAVAQVTRIIVHDWDVLRVSEEVQHLAPYAQVHSSINTDEDPQGLPHLIVECAGHGALGEHVLPALRAGIPAVVASIGALHDAALAIQLADAATLGRTQVQLISGAIGGMDALAAARVGGLASVRYIGRKPPLGWRATPAEKLCDLATLTAPFTLFAGSAREAARLYPKNANVAATVSLAGLGLDETHATLIADPAVCRNVHRVIAEGAFGRLDLTVENDPLPDNPKTSALTVYSIVRAIHNATRPIAL